MCLRTKPWPLDSFKMDLNLIDDILEKVTSAVRGKLLESFKTWCSINQIGVYAVPCVQTIIKLN